MAEKKVIELEVNSNLGTLKQQFKEAQIEVQALSDKFGATSAQAVEAAKSAALLKDKIGDAKALTDAFNPDAKFKAVTGALTGVAGGFSVVTGALGAFGKQNESVEKALLKVQSAMAIASGAQAIGESIDSFKQLGAVIKATSIYQAAYNFIQTGSIKGTQEAVVAKVTDAQATVAQGTATVATSVATTGASTALKLLRAALISTGIGALIVGLGLLIANLDSIIGFFSGATEANEGYSASIKKNTAALNTQIKSNEKASTALKTKNTQEYKMAEASGASANALHKLAIRHANEEIALERASKATAHNSYVKEKNTLAYLRNIGASDDVIKKQEALTKATMENSIKEGKDLAAAIENKAALIRDNEVRIAGENHSRSQKTHEKKVKTEKGQSKELIDITKNIEDENIRLMDEGQAKEEAVILLAYKRKKEEQDKQLKDKSLKQKDYDTLQTLNKEGQEADLLAIEQKYILQAEEARKTAQEKKDTEFFRQENLLAELTDTAQQKLYDKYKIEQEAAEGNAELLLALENKYNKDKEALDKEAADKEIAIAKSVSDAKIAIQQQSLDVALQGIDLVKTLFEKSKGIQKAALIAESAIGIAKMIISTKAANAATTLKYAAIPGGLAFASAEIALNNVSTGIGIAANIAATAKGLKALGGGGAPSGDSVGGGGGAPNMSAPQFNVVGQSGVNQLASLNQQPIQAYVVSGQVTSQQALDRNRLANATLGG
jgi:hypothetical protein